MTFRIAVDALKRRYRDAETLTAPTVSAAAAASLHGSLQIRHVDAGSCNGCELELSSAFSPVYDVERYGVRLVASPRHADALIVTGPVTHNLREPLLKTFGAMPEPRLVISLGDCARDCGEFRGAYGVAGSVDEVLTVDAHIPGCPPRPGEIVSVLRTFTGQ
ncbi:MAG: oxidoreductase [Acidobacteriota bacterium]|nr:oxidoreductase [Acidobacteriota bacterium]